MIRVDVAPTPVEETALAAWAGLPWKTLGSSLAVFCVVASIFLGLAHQTQTVALQTLSGDVKKLQPQLKQLEETEASIRALQNRAKIRQMLKAPEAQWAPRLNLLSEAIVSYLWFTSLRFETPPPPPPMAPEAVSKNSLQKAALSSKKLTENPKHAEKPPSPVLILSGSALVTPDSGGSAVSRYLERLKGRESFSRWFRSIELKSVQQRQVQQEQVNDFVISLTPTES